jgi:hypothetical protein
MSSSGTTSISNHRGDVVAGKQTACDVDPDCPDALEQERIPNRLAPPSQNPFEEFFESEEVVTEAFVRGTIAHNQQACQLTRAILEEYRVDDLEIQSIQNWKSQAGEPIAPVMESVGTEATVPFPTSGGKTDLVFQNSVIAQVSHIDGAGRADDRDMLITSRVNQLPAPASGKHAEQDEDTPVSTGRAYRMDYKQLFTRLRNTMAPGTTENTRQG